jgi:TetR/AcrR family transcriptional regulator, fatty acid metabolism regulator protein
MASEQKGTGGNGREGDRKSAILRAAVEVFATKGYHGCRIADVAKEAGVAYGLVYHYFKNKDELLQSVFHQGFETFSSKLRAVVESDASLAEKVRGVAEFSLDIFRDDPRTVRVLILQIARSTGNRGLNRHSAWADLIRLCVEMFQKAQERGELNPDMDPVLAAATLFGTIEMGLTAFVTGLFDAQDPEVLERAKRQLATGFLTGVLTPQSGAELEWNQDRSDTRLKTAKRS